MHISAGLEGKVAGEADRDGVDLVEIVVRPAVRVAGSIGRSDVVADDVMRGIRLQLARVVPVVEREVLGARRQPGRVDRDNCALLVGQPFQDREP
jgi:hypothetical protein